MKKQLLSLGCALLMAFSLSSTAWGLTVEFDKIGTIVSAPDSTFAASDYRPAMAIDAQGNQIVSGLIGTDFEFAGVTVGSEVDGSHYLLKYDAEGKEMWAATFLGATITALTTDPEGNVYAAASFGESALIYAAGETVDLQGDMMGARSAVIVKLSADGKVLDKNVLTPALHSDWGDEGFALDAPRAWFEQLAYENGRLYGSLVNTGLLKEGKDGEIDLTAPYVNMWGMILLQPTGFYVEFAESGSVSIKKVLSSVGMVKGSEETATVQRPIFTIDNGVMYQAASVSGVFNYTAPDGATTLYEKANHQGFLLGTVALDGSSSASNVWMSSMESTPIDTLQDVNGEDSLVIWQDAVGGYYNYITDIAVNNGRIFVAGVFDVASCPFAKDVPFAGTMDAFIAAVYPDLKTVAYVKASGLDEGTDIKTAYETVGAFSSQWNCVVLLATASDKIDHIFQQTARLTVHPFTYEATSDIISEEFFPMNAVSQGRTSVIALAKNTGEVVFSKEAVIPSAVEEIEANAEDVVESTMVSDVIAFNKAVNATLTTTTGVALKTVENATEMSVSEYPAGYYLLIVDGAQAVKIVKL